MTNKMRRVLMVCGVVVAVGLLFSIIGLAFGGTKGFAAIEERVPFVDLGVPGKTIQEVKEFDRVTSVDIRSEIGKVEFIEGDRYKVEVEYSSRMKTPTIELSGNELRVESIARRGKVIHLGWFGDWNHEEASVRVYYPRGAKFDNVKVANDLGDLQIEDLTAKRLDINLAAGNAELDTVEVEDLTAEMDAGSLKGRNLVTKGVNATLSMGQIDIAGVLYGMTNIECDMGDCTITTALPETAYSITTFTDLGDSKINGRSAGDQTITNAGAKNKIEAKSSMGTVHLNFQ